MQHRYWQWSIEAKLEDFDFAVDLVNIKDSWNKVQRKQTNMPFPSHQAIMTRNQPR